MGYGGADMADINEAKRLVLAQYEQEREDLDRMITRLRKDLGISEHTNVSLDVGNGGVESKLPFGASNVLQLIKPGDLFGMSQVEAAKTVLNYTGHQPLSLQEIAAALHRGKATDTLIEGIALRNLSSLLSRSDDFISVAKGRWGLADWYPNKVKKSRKQKESDQSDEKKEGKNGEAVAK
jgi:hypothetical protein